MLLDDSLRLVEAALAAGVEALLDVVPDQQHTFQMSAGRAPQADAAIARLAAWVRPRLGLAADRHLCAERAPVAARRPTWAGKAHDRRGWGAGVRGSVRS